MNEAHVNKEPQSTQAVNSSELKPAEQVQVALPTAPENTDITHSFSRAQAQHYGVHGAILLRYFINRIKGSNNIKDRKRWFYDSVSDLKENYPYLSQTALFNARKLLIAEKGPIVTGNYNKWPKDKTTWYSARDDRTLQALEDDLLYFKVSEAVAYGILEAVILNNLRYWLQEKQKKNAQYQYHPMSPRKLHEVFQGVFSRNSIDRALKHLVEVGVLIPKAPGKANDPVAYRFAGPEDMTKGGPTENEVAQPRTGEEGGPTENEVAQNEGCGPTKNTPGPIEKIAGPTENEGGSTENNLAQPRTTVAQPRTTIPINNSLKEDCLKDCLEGCLKEDRFKASSVGVSSKILPDAASLGQSQSGSNAFVEPIAHPAALPESALNQAPNTVEDTIDGSTSALSAQPARNEVTEPIAGPFTPPAAPTLPQPNQAPNAFPEPIARPLSVPPKPASPPYQNEPWYTFLDLDCIHKECWEVMQFHDKTQDTIYQNMAATIVGVAERLIDETDPALIYRLLKLPDQRTLNGEIFLWSDKYFSDIFDQHLAVPECPENDELRELLRKHSLCFLNMAFHCLKFDYHIYLGKPYAQLKQALWNRLAPWIDEQKAKQRNKALEERKIKFASPDLDKEANPNLSAPEKVQVLLQSLQARNRIGKFDQYGELTEQVVEITHNTPLLARHFFQLNPHFTVQHINLMLDACLKLPTCTEEHDPQWHARNGYKISLLLNNLTQVATQLNMLSRIPAFTPLPVEEK
jgi:hypothetical protein